MAWAVIAFGLSKHVAGLWLEFEKYIGKKEHYFTNNEK